MNTIIGELGKSQKFIDLSNQIEKEKSPISISGLTSVGMTELVSAINGYNKKSILLVTYNEIQAKKIVQNLQTFEKDKVVFFPKKEVVTYDYIAESKDIPYKRIEALNKIATKKNLVVITTIEAATQKLPQKDVLYRNKLHFKTGESYNLEELKQKLVSLGYSRYDLIEGRGQFSVRGGIVDISADDKIGIRIELWGDEVDSIRNFSISSQRSISTLEKAKIYPANEYVLDDKIENICKRIRQKLTEGKQDEIIEEDLEQIKAGNYISKIDKYFDEFYKEQETLIDYMSKDCLIMVDEVNKVEQREMNILQDIENLSKNLIEKVDFDASPCRRQRLFLTRLPGYGRLINRISHKNALYSNVPAGKSFHSPAKGGYPCCKRLPRPGAKPFPARPGRSIPDRRCAGILT